MGVAVTIQNALSDFWSRRNIDDIYKPDEFSGKLNGIISRSKSAAVNRLPEGLSADQKCEFEKSVNAYLCEEGSPTQKEVKDLVEHYRKLHQLLEESMRVKSSNLHLDWIERMRFLGFRLVTGIGIAAIVLATGYLAKLWSIPLPLLKLVS